ncbi:MAG: TlpA disulfide reductase family protein [Cecembia sp.]
MTQKKLSIILVFTLWAGLFSCTEKQNTASELQGFYHAKLDIGENHVPFFLRVKENAGGWAAEIINGKEALDYDEVYVKGDSIKIIMGIFDAEIRAKVDKNGQLQGEFLKNNVAGYSIPFLATPGSTQRFATTKDPAYDFTGKWKTVFTHEDGNVYDAIGIFEQDGNQISGTFLTKLGDYRFLDGNVGGDTFYLSAFDGSHVYYFEGSLDERGDLIGKFRSGPRYMESFTASRDEEFELPDAYSFNYLKPEFETFNFTFPDVDGKMVSLDDESFKDKVVLVQLFGTWCPNCMDETKFLAEWYKKNKERGIEIVALAFESRADFDYASTRVKKAKDRMGADYTFLIAGESNKEKASEALPALNQVIAFPTLIYLDKQGQVRKIHTGFNGPGTGLYYQDWVEAHEQLVNELLQE